MKADFWPFARLGFALALPPSAAAPAPTTAFVDVNLIAMEDACVEAHSTIVVRGSRIIAVGPSSSTPPHADALVIDGDGRYALPGLVDSHVHITTDMPSAPASRRKPLR